MTRTLVFVLWVLASGAAVAQSASQTLTDVDAIVVKAGPYGEHWSVTITRQGQAFVRYTSFRPTGSTIGDFIVGQEHLATIQAVAKANDFTALKPELRPATMPLHAPDYLLSLHFGGVTQKVWVYDPNNVDEKDQLRRFGAVWDAVWSAMPFRPLPFERANSASQPTR